MKPIQVDKLSLRELTELSAKVQAAIEPAKRREKEVVLEEIKTIAQSHGLSVHDILGRPTRGRQPMPRDIVKYRHPTTGATWSGRGRPPRWIEGQEKDKFAIAASQPTK